MQIRKRIIARLLVLLGVAGVLWSFLLLSNSRRVVRVDLTVSGITNVNGEQVALVRLRNSGNRTVEWNGADIPWRCRAETRQGWTNFVAGYMTGGGWLIPATNQDFEVRLPEGTRRWQVGVSFQEASPRMELGARIYHLKFVRFVPDFVWDLIPRTPGKDHEIWSEVFTNFVEAKP